MSALSHKEHVLACAKFYVTHFASLPVQVRGHFEIEGSTVTTNVCIPIDRVGIAVNSYNEKHGTKVTVEEVLDAMVWL